MPLLRQTILFLACLGIFHSRAAAQGQIVPGAPVTLQNAPQRDTTTHTNSATWRDEAVSITFRQASSLRTYSPDSSLHTFHRRPFLQPWYRDLGNLGSPVMNRFYTPEQEDRTGPSLGYHVFDVYRMDADSVSYYNTTRPYTSFGYRLGSRLEQLLQVLHTQNITPSWNFAVQYRKINSQGYYSISRTNHDNGSLSTHYVSKNQHYGLFGAFVYNKEQQDENGGIVSDTFLSNIRYTDRQTVPVAFNNPFYSARRSSVTNVLRDFNILLQHSYTWGRTDTLYNADSTQFHFQLIPRFSVSHRLELGSQKYTFKNLQADSTQYASFFRTHLGETDSVFTQQEWVWVDNRVMLNGFLGKKENPLQFSAGAGNRLDNFSTFYIPGTDRDRILSNYLMGEIRKEALQGGQWSYNGFAQLFVTGEAAGDFLLKGVIGKDLGKRWGMISAGFRQQLANAPYNFTTYRNQYFSQTGSFSKTSVTEVYGTLQSSRLGIEGGVRDYIFGNYLYLADSLEGVSNGRLQMRQYSTPFSLTQAWIRKAFYFGSFVLDNEITFQQVAGSAPLEVPLFTGRHQISYEAFLFKKALKVATGVEGLYHSPYHPAGYAPLYNRFYYQTAYTSGSDAEASVFFNFKVKRFRAYLMADQLQTLLGYHNMPVPGYPTQELMIRFGFDWIMVN